MRWGHRKKENLVGVGATRLRLQSKYINKGSTDEEAKKKTDNAIRRRKIAAIVGITAVTAGAAYAAKVAYGKRFSGVILKQGAKVKNVNVFGDELDLDRRLYTSFEKGDSRKYRGMLARALRKNDAITEETSTIYETTLKAKEAIKAPSNKQAEQIYNQLLKTDSDFKPQQITWDMLMGKEDAAPVFKSYRQFNKEDLLEETPNAKKFMSALKEKGFNALLDQNDQYISGYNAKKPLIIFNAQSTLAKDSQRIIKDIEAKRLNSIQISALVTRQMAPTVGLGASLIGLSNATDTRKKYGAVNDYIKKNPNSKYKYERIYNSLEQDKTGKYHVDNGRLKKG